MITWFYGNSGAGKTTIAKALAQATNAIHLDGDDLRNVWNDLGLSRDDRIVQNDRVYYLAKLLESQGFDIVVSVICPFKHQRDSFGGIKFIFVPGGKSGDDYPFEP